MSEDDDSNCGAGGCWGRHFGRRRREGTLTAVAEEAAGGVDDRTDTGVVVALSSGSELTEMTTSPLPAQE